MSKTTENVIVIIIMVAIVIGLLYFVGYDNIEDWLSTPFVWKEPDYLSIEYAGTYDAREGKELYNFNKYILFRSVVWYNFSGMIPKGPYVEGEKI